MADSYLFAIKHNEATLGDNPLNKVVFSDAAIKAFKEGGNLIYPNTDWVNYIVKDAAAQSQYNFNVSGGSRNIKYFVSLGYLNQDGLFNTFDTDYSYQFGYKRYNYRTNLDLNLTETTKLSLTIGGRSEMRQQPGSQPSEGIFTVLYWAVPYSGMLYEGKRILLTNRYIPTSEKKDGLNAIGWGTGYQRGLNNIMNMDFGIDQDLKAITKGLAWRFKFSNNSTNVHNKTRTTSKATYDPYYTCDVGGTAGDSTIVFKKSGSDGLLGYSESSSKARNWYMETALTYDNSFGPHNVTGLLLYNQSKTFYPSQYSDIPFGYVGIAGRVTYDYRMKYLLDVNLGYNGSENFAPGNRFGFFPAVSVGWAVTEENFLKGKIAGLDFLKLRVSIGTVGNDRLGSNRFLYLPDSYSANSGSYSFGTINPTDVREASEGALGNPNVTWEKALKQNYGFDMRLWKGKLTASVDVFFENRKNILTTRNTVPGILAISLPAQNIGEVENKGYEIELGWRDRRPGGLNYYLTGNMSFCTEPEDALISLSVMYLKHSGRQRKQPITRIIPMHRIFRNRVIPDMPTSTEMI
jgi:TonB-linked SusC/RagA family outer membrane protein